MDRCDIRLHHGLPSDGVSRLMGFCGVFEALIKLSELKELRLHACTICSLISRLANMYLIDKVLDGAGKNEVDFVHVPAEPVCHLSHLVRPNEVDCRVDHPALKIMQVHHLTPIQHTVAPQPSTIFKN